MTLTSHDVTTFDGYICTMFRITHPNVKATKGPVLLQHGLMDSADTWVVIGDKSLAFVLARSGYDVFLGNSRGNKYAKRHVSLDPKSDEFWDFSWDEMAAYDLPAFVDFILGFTGYSQLSYVGHSQGTTQMFAALVTQPEFAKKILNFIALAPVAYVANTSSKILAEAADLEVDRIVERFGINEFLPSNLVSRNLLPAVCDARLSSWMCTTTLALVSGFNKDQYEDGVFGVVFVHYPSGTSGKTMIHWAQSIRNYDGDRSDFSHFDYGSTMNNRLYGQTKALEYDISQFPSSVNLMLASGGLDKLADPTDVSRLKEHLPHPFTSLMLAKYEHSAFVWGKNAVHDVYKPLMTFIDQGVKKSGGYASFSGSSDDSDSSMSTTTITFIAVAAVATVSLFTLFAVKYVKSRKQEDVYVLIPIPTNKSTA
jgi:pimeloyl-ACP methyl ester carboxylesterase